MSDLPTAQNGRFTINHNPPYAEGNRAELICNQGYIATGVTESVFEMSASNVLQWNPPSATCVPFLNDLPTAENGTFNGTGNPPFTAGARATLTCNHGYDVVGPTESVLELSANNNQLQWNPASGLCTAPLQDFPRLPSGNGRFESNSGPPFKVDDEVTLKCDAGHQYDHGSFKVALDGNLLKWNPESAHCIPFTCPTPPIFDHAIIDGHSFTYPNNVTYSCEAGYTLSGHATGKFQCSDNGQWRDAIPLNLSCIPITCPELKAPLHGQLQCPSREVNQNAFIICDAGYKLDNSLSGTRVCQADGTWSGDEATCVPLVPCQLLPEMTNIKLISPSSVVLDCGNGKEDNILCENLKWVKNPPYCVSDPQQLQGVDGGGADPIDLNPVDPKAKKNANIPYVINATQNVLNKNTATSRNNRSASNSPASTSGAAGKPAAASPFSYGYWIVAIIIAIVTSVLVWFATRFWLRNRIRLGTVKI